MDGYPQTHEGTAQAVVDRHAGETFDSSISRTFSKSDDRGRTTRRLSQIGSTRREMLVGLGAVGAGLAGISLAAQTASAADGGEPTGTMTDAGTGFAAASMVVAGAAPVTVGEKYYNIAGVDLRPTSHLTTFASGWGELQSSGGGFFYSNLPLPAGARITELVAYFIKTVDTIMHVALDIELYLVRSDGSRGEIEFSPTFLAASTNSAPPSSQVQTLIVPVPDVVEAVVNPTQSSHFLNVRMPASAVTHLRGVRVGYTTMQTSFVPVTAGRVYDSRWTIFGGTKIRSGEDRVISTRDQRRISPDDGAVVLADLVPSGAAAIALNLSITDTVGGGFLSVAPGDASTFASASINWSESNQILNNGTVAKVDANRQVRVFAGGGGATHFIIDVTGYYI
jgi:hypothetical protein